MPHGSRRSTAILGATIVTAAAAALWYMPGATLSVRFSYPPLNYVAFAVIVGALPVGLGVLAYSAPHVALKWLLGIVTAITAFPAAMVCWVSLFDAAQVGIAGSDDSMERLDHIETPSGIYAMYRTNGGATTSFGILIRKESSVVPGFLLVRILKHFYPARYASWALVGNDRVRVTVAPYSTEYSGETWEFQM